MSVLLLSATNENVTHVDFNRHDRARSITKIPETSTHTGRRGVSVKSVLMIDRSICFIGINHYFTNAHRTKFTHGPT